MVKTFFKKKMSLIISLIISKILGNIILGYVRVSSREQINGTGIERQIKAIETFAEDKGLEERRIQYDQSA